MKDSTIALGAAGTVFGILLIGFGISWALIHAALELAQFVFGFAWEPTAGKTAAIAVLTAIARLVLLR